MDPTKVVQNMDTPFEDGSFPTKNWTYSGVCETPLQTHPIVAFCKPHYCQKPPTKKKIFDDQNLIFGNQNFLFLKFESININGSKFFKKDEHEELRNFFLKKNYFLFFPYINLVNLSLRLTKTQIHGPKIYKTNRH